MQKNFAVFAPFLNFSPNISDVHRNSVEISYISLLTASSGRKFSSNEPNHCLLDIMLQFHGLSPEFHEILDTSSKIIDVSGACPTLFNISRRRKIFEANTSFLVFKNFSQNVSHFKLKLKLSFLFVCPEPVLEKGLSLNSKLTRGKRPFS